MDSPTCVNKIDVVIDNKNVTFSKCCLTMSVNNVVKPFEEVYKMSDEEIFNLIWNLSSAKSDIIEKSQEFNCNGTCVSDWQKHPTVLGVSTKICNLKCVMCRDEIYTSPTISKEKELYFRVLNIANNISEIQAIVPAVLGEFFVFKNEAIQFLRDAKNKNKEVCTASNLILIDDEMLSELLSGEFKNYDLIASIDSFNPEIYMQMRRGATRKEAEHVFKNFDIICQNQSALRSFRVNTVLFPSVNFIKEDIQNTVSVFKKHNFDNFFLFKANQTPIEEYTSKEWWTPEFQKEAHFSYSY